MIRLSRFIRSTPKLFYFIAGLDFVRYALPLTELYFDGRFNGMDYQVGLELSLITTVLSGIVYATQWVAYGVFATLLIAIHDRLALPGRDEAELEVAE